MKHRTCCFTGHRNIPEKEYLKIKKHLENEIENLIHQGIVYFGNGGALGFDTLASLTVLELREKYPQIKLIMVLPCKNQDKRWNGYDKKIYADILDNADKIVWVSKQPYFDGCMKLRNEYLVEHSGFCVAYMKHGRSGTSQTVHLARKQGLKVINLVEII